MRLFRIGFVLTVSFLLFLMTVTATFGFYPAPQGPKAPDYPTSAFSLRSDSASEDAYTKQMDAYQTQQKQYQDGQKAFLQAKIVPYARNVFVVWVVALLVYVAVGTLLAKFASELVGAAYTFTGAWAVFFGPMIGLIWFATSLVSSFGQRANQQFTADPIFQAVAVVSFIGVVVLTVLGIFLFGNAKQSLTTSSQPTA